MKRYYELNSDGQQIANYARRQKGKDLILLDEPENNMQKYNKKTKKWIIDSSLEKKHNIEFVIQELKESESDMLKVFEDFLSLVDEGKEIKINNLPSESKKIFKDRQNKKAVLKELLK